MSEQPVRTVAELLSLGVAGWTLRYDLKVATELEKDLPVPSCKLVCSVHIAGEIHVFTVDVGCCLIERKEVMEIRDCPSMLPKQLSPFPVCCQPKQYSFADKIHAACRRGSGNGRIRDYYDLYLYTISPDFRDGMAAEALQAVFPLYASKRYGSEMPASVADIPALSAEFATANAEQWEGLRTGNTWLLHLPDLHRVIKTISERLHPILVAASTPAMGVAA